MIRRTADRMRPSSSFWHIHLAEMRDLRYLPLQGRDHRRAVRLLESWASTPQFHLQQFHRGRWIVSSKPDRPGHDSINVEGYEAFSCALSDLEKKKYRMASGSDGREKARPPRPARQCASASDLPGTCCSPSASSASTIRRAFLDRMLWRTDALLTAHHRARGDGFCFMQAAGADAARSRPITNPSRRGRRAGKGEGGGLARLTASANGGPFDRKLQVVARHHDPEEVFSCFAPPSCASSPPA